MENKIIIKESDFFIKKEPNQFVVYLLKGKKELLENSEDKYKIGGYYYDITCALKSVLAFRKSKKYPGKESFDESIPLLKAFIKRQNNFNIKINILYKKIFEIKENLNLYGRN